MKNSIINDDFIGRLEAMSLHMHSPMRGYFGGNHRTNTYGSTVEFADFREYILGDDIRRIDWNLYSRFEKHYIKLFVDERQMHIQIFLDCSASMGKNNQEKSFYAMRVAAALGFLSVHNMDRTSYHLMKGEFAEDLCGTITGKDAFFRAMGQLEETTFAGSADIEKAVTGCVNLGSNDGLTVIISDFMTDSDWKKAVNYLCYKKRQVMLIQVLTPEEIDPSFNGRMRLVDSESTDPLDERNMRLRITKGNLKAYQEALKDFRSEMKQFCAARGVHYFSVKSNEPVEKLVFGSLYETGSVK